MKIQLNIIGIKEIYLGGGWWWACTGLEDGLDVCLDTTNDSGAATGVAVMLTGGALEDCNIFSILSNGINDKKL